MMSWKKKREIRLHYDAEADAHDELYSDEKRKKYELLLRRIAYGGDWIRAVTLLSFHYDCC